MTALQITGVVLDIVGIGLLTVPLGVLYGTDLATRLYHEGKSPELRLLAFMIPGEVCAVTGAVMGFYSVFG